MGLAPLVRTAEAVVTEGGDIDDVSDNEALAKKQRVGAPRTVYKC